MPMSGKELLKLLAKDGWRVLRINGSHNILEKPGVPFTLSVPVHGNRTLAIGTEKQILKKAGLA